MSIQIYAACLSSYNNGILHGVHIEVSGDTDVSEIHEAIAEMLKASPMPDAEEYAIHDYDFDADQYGKVDSFGEWPDFEKLIEHVRLCEEHGAAWLAYVSCVGEDYATPEGFEAEFIGEYESLEDWAYEFMNDVYDIPGYLAIYIDYEQFARDSVYGGDISFVKDGGSVFLFRNN